MGVTDRYLKADLRLAKIAERGLKSHYGHLTGTQKRLVKAMEQVAQCEKEMWSLETVQRRADWRQTETGQIILERYFRASERAARLRARLGLDPDGARELLASTRTNRFYGGSF